MSTDQEYVAAFNNMVATLRKKGFTDEDLLTLSIRLNTDDKFRKDLLDTLRKEKNG